MPLKSKVKMMQRRFLTALPCWTGSGWPPSGDVRANPARSWIAATLGMGLRIVFFQLSQDDFSWWMFQLRIPQAVFPGPEQTRRIVSYRARQIKMKPFFRRGVSPLNGRTHCGFPFRVCPPCGCLLEKRAARTAEPQK